MVKSQLVAFALVTIVTVTYCAVTYVRLPEQFGLNRHIVTVLLGQTGDLYPNARVTLRGVTIGTVTRIDLTDVGASATLSVRDDVRIPEDSRISVRSMSAIGEQYLDFEPSIGREPAGGALAAGDVVPAGRVRLPTDDSELLGKVNALAASVPSRDLSTTVGELSAALSGRSGELRWLLDSADGLVQALGDNVAPTRRLIDDLGPVLDTQRDLSPRIRSIAGDLATVTGQLRRSDPQLRGIIDKTPRPNVQQTLVMLPTALNDLQSAIYNTPIPNAAKLSFKTVVNDAPPCTTGFLGSRQREPNDLSPAPPAVDAYCKEPSSSRIGVRMGRNDPCPNDPARRSRTASGCGLNFQSPREALRAREDAVRTQLEVAAKNPASVSDGARPHDGGGGR
jgi:phospholipid/cholesterol/gamma-HCH transport system substrate-binding protein